MAEVTSAVRKAWAFVRFSAAAAIGILLFLVWDVLMRTTELWRPSRAPCGR